MQIKRAPIKPQDYDKVVHIDQSATHWALEHSRHAAASQDALSTFRDLTSAKNKVVTELCKAAGFGMERVVQARLVKDGEDAFVEVAVQDEPVDGVPEAPPEAAPPEAPAPAS
jgi:hypothetical protein